MLINYVCSLGDFCHTAQILKNNNLKLCSYPFDWIFSNNTLILDCLEDKFTKFLDKSYYVSVSKNICGHTLYNDKLWRHHNPLLNNDHYEYYKRCINRFNNLLEYKEDKLFIMFCVNMKEITHENINNLIEFNNKFSKYVNNYTLLIILHVPNKTLNYTFQYIDNIHFLKLETESVSNGIKFIKNNENKYLNDIINQNYTFNLKPI